MFVWIVLAIIVVIGLLLIYGALQPADFSVSREADFKAAPAKVFAQVNDFKNWSSWSPWERIDPDMKRSFGEKTAGVGAQYSWVGNKKVGEGSMEITQSEPSNRMQLDLHFIKPFQANNVCEFTISPSENGSHLRWDMRGSKPFMFRVMGLFFNMDKMVGGDFEKGLANLRGIVEK